MFLEPDDERMNLDDYKQILIGNSFTDPLHHTPHELHVGESSIVPTVPATTTPVLPAITPLYLERTLIFMPFLEESHRKIYCRMLFNYPYYLRYGVTKMKNKARQREFNDKVRAGTDHYKAAGKDEDPKTRNSFWFEEEDCHHMG